VKFEANVAITGEFTTTIADHELAQNSTATGKSVTINLSEATTEAGEKDFYIPLPTGSYEGFKVSAIDASDNVLSSYTTYKTYTLKLGDIALFDLKTQGTNVKVLNKTTCVGTTDSEADSKGYYTRTWNFGDGWGIYNKKTKIDDLKALQYGSEGSSYENYMKMSKNQDFFITVPNGKQITKISFSASVNKDNTTSTVYTCYINNLGDKTFSATDYVYLSKIIGIISEYTFVPKTGLTGDIKLRLGGNDQALMTITITYTDIAE
jgi:hypothetical protein